MSEAEKELQKQIEAQRALGTDTTRTKDRLAREEKGNKHARNR